MNLLALLFTDLGTGKHHWLSGLCLSSCGVDPSAFSAFSSLRVLQKFFASLRLGWIERLLRSWKCAAWACPWDASTRRSHRFDWPGFSLDAKSDQVQSSKIEGFLGDWLLSDSPWNFHPRSSSLALSDCWYTATVGKNGPSSGFWDHLAEWPPPCFAGRASQTSGFVSHLATWHPAKAGWIRDRMWDIGDLLGNQHLLSFDWSVHQKSKSAARRASWLVPSSDWNAVQGSNAEDCWADSLSLSSGWSEIPTSKKKKKTMHAPTYARR